MIRRCICPACRILIAERDGRFAVFRPNTDQPIRSLNVSTSIDADGFARYKVAAEECEHSI
jgi:hypothetical protein